MWAGLRGVWAVLRRGLGGPERGGGFWAELGGGRLQEAGLRGEGGFWEELGGKGLFQGAWLGRGAGQG